MTKSKLFPLVVAGVLFVGFVAAGCAGDRGGDASATADDGTSAPAPAPGEPDLASVRSATEKYQDVNVALADGYIRDPGDVCDTADMMGRPATDGAMGIHFVRMDLLGIAVPPEGRVTGTGTHVDFLSPSVLLYEPQADGSLELVGVENLAFAEAWSAAGHATRPSFHGVPFDYMADDPATTIDEAHMFEPHYDRHVWIYRENPNGVFAQFNPNVTCEHHASSAGHVHETL